MVLPFSELLLYSNCHHSRSPVPFVFTQTRQSHELDHRELWSAVTNRKKEWANVELPFLNYMSRGMGREKDVVENVLIGIYREIYENMSF